MKYNKEEYAVNLWMFGCVVGGLHVFRILSKAYKNGV